MDSGKVKSGRIFLIGFAIVVAAVSAILTIPNPVGKYVISEAKANGFLEYEPMEAYELAQKTCTQCHTIERIKLYCPRCGPPFVAVIPHMQSVIANYQQTKPELKYKNITQHQAVVIAQVWNALVGNWEGDFREKDMLKLIGRYDKLVALYKTPVAERKIEVALLARDDLKVGHMSNMADMQKDLGKPEAETSEVPQNPCSGAAAGSQGHDHSKMDHGKMDHGSMEHQGH